MRYTFRNRNWKVRLIQLVSHALVIFNLHAITPLWALVSYLVFFVFFCVGVNIGAHRYFSHQTFKTYPVFEYLFGFVFTLATVGSSLAWVGMHREHHKYSDTPQDPHTPRVFKKGESAAWKFLKVYLGIWSKYTAKPQFNRDLRQSSLHQFFHFYYVLIILAYVGLLSLISFDAVVFAYCLPSVLVFHAASFIVTAGHYFGSVRHQTGDYSHDSFFLHVLTCGEGLHNQHHAKPGMYRYKAPVWYMFDVPGFLIDSAFRRKTV